MKPLKILILDNNREEQSFGSKDLVGWAIKTAPKGSEVLVRRSPDRDLPSIDQPVDAVVISGSITSCLEKEESWIRPYDEFVTEHIKKGTPMLGVCYGHQTIARCLSKIHGETPTLRVAPKGEFGWQKVRITDQSRILDGLKDGFFTFESHYEEVVETPPGAKKIAETDHCGLQGYEVTDKPIFGVQFHPEYSIEEGETSVANKIKKGVNPEWIFNPGKGEKLYDENVGKVIFGNFFRIAGSQ